MRDQSWTVYCVNSCDPQVNNGDSGGFKVAMDSKDVLYLPIPTS